MEVSMAGASRTGRSSRGKFDVRRSVVHDGKDHGSGKRMDLWFPRSL